MSAASCVSSFPLSRESIDLGQRKHDEVTAHWYKLLFEIKRHESYFRSQPEELRSGLATKGIATPGEMDCQLALLDSIDPSPEVVRYLRQEHQMSKDFCAMGFVIVETATGSPIAVTIEDGR